MELIILIAIFSMAAVLVALIFYVNNMGGEFLDMALICLNPAIWCTTCYLFHDGIMSADRANMLSGVSTILILAVFSIRYLSGRYEPKRKKTPYEEVFGKY